MSSPLFEVVATLTQQDTLYYLPLEAPTRDGTRQGKLALRLEITHVDPNHDTLTITGINFSYPGTQIPSQKMEHVPDCNTVPEDGVLHRGDTANWTNGTCLDENHNPTDWNQVYFDMPGPQFVRISIRCAETEHPFVVEYRLAARTGAPFLLPFARDDLNDDEDEYVVTSAKHKFVGGQAGTQIYAHDIRIYGRVDGKLSDSRIANPTENADARTFGRPIRGMADGIVTEVITTIERKSGFELHDGGIVNRRGGIRPADDGPEYQTTFVDCYDNPLGGVRSDVHYGPISVTVDYGGILVKYSHLKYQSVCVEEGDTVWPGRKIAEAGNTGNTRGVPHLHMECRIKVVPGADRLCGMAFKKAWMIDYDLVKENQSPPEFVHLDGLGIPYESVALRPFSTHFEPQPAGDRAVEVDELTAEIFGGISRGGDGIVIVNGKLRRVPPRGIRGEILGTLVDHDEIAELPVREQAKRRTALAGRLESLAKKLRS